MNRWLQLVGFTALLGAPGCNVFFSTNSVEFGESGDAPCSGSCVCEEDCSRQCERDCTLTCERNASCDFVLDSGGSVRCEPGSNCHVTCDGGDCEVDCEGSCTMECAPRSDSCGWDKCEGQTNVCSARELACNSNCPD